MDDFTCHVASFRVAGVALVTCADVFGDVSKIVIRGRRNTFATFSEHALHFSWQAQHFGRVQLHFSWQAQHFRRVVACFFRKSHWHGCLKW